MKNSKLPIIPLILLTLSLWLLGKTIPAIIYNLFAYPAAFLASLFFGSTLLLTPEHKILIPLINQPIHVIGSCSAYEFFCLLYVISAWRISVHVLKPTVFLLLLVPVAYALTILTNACRIICAYQVYGITKLLLPSHFQGAVHQGVGIILFLLVLITTYSLLERIFHAGHKHS